MAKTPLQAISIHASLCNAASAAEAIQDLETSEFDVMFTDIRVGRQSGMDLLIEAQERWPRLIVVMLTGKGTIESAIRTRREKPVF